MSVLVAVVFAAGLGSGPVWQGGMRAGCEWCSLWYSSAYAVDSFDLSPGSNLELDGY